MSEIYRQTVGRPMTLFLGLVLLVLAGVWWHRSSAPGPVAGGSVVDVEAAAKKGDPRSQTILGHRYERGLGGKIADPAQAVYWYKKAAAQGWARAENALGILSKKGKGLPKDYHAAREWFIKASEHGWVVAKHNLALLYLKGNGVPKDPKRAFSLFEEAAAKGSVASIHAMGWCYETGSGVLQDPSKAVGLYRKAARKGLPRAEKDLRRLGNY